MKTLHLSCPHNYQIPATKFQQIFNCHVSGIAQRTIPSLPRGAHSLLGSQVIKYEAYRRGRLTSTLKSILRLPALTIYSHPAFLFFLYMSFLVNPQSLSYQYFHSPSPLYFSPLLPSFLPSSFAFFFPPQPKSHIKTPAI